MTLFDPHDDQLLPYAVEPCEGPAHTPIAHIPVLSHLAPPAIEYATLRTSCVLFDEPHRSVISVHGKDRIGFLNSMLTQQLRDIGDEGKPNARSSFWLDKAGRIQTDLRVVALPDRVVMTCDAHDSSACVRALDTFLFAEDVVLKDAHADWHCFSLHGPIARELLAGAIDDADGAQQVREIAEDHAIEVGIGGVRVVVDRCDGAGVVGLSLIVPTSHAHHVAATLLTLGNWHRHEPMHEPGAAIEKHLVHLEDPSAKTRIRPIGWYAMNTARIEAGTPMFHLDFGTTSLPAETGVVNNRVSFTKGCYLGQEIVARMHARNAVKQIVRALKPVAIEGIPIPRDAHGQHLLPVAGTPVFPMDLRDALAAGDADAAKKHVGTITSATISPMRSGMPIALATVRWKHAAPGTNLLTIAEGEFVVMQVQEELKFI